jgi:CxxC motif-containing protein (DUF1111 family)
VTGIEATILTVGRNKASSPSAAITPEISQDYDFYGYFFDSHKISVPAAATTADS